MLCTTSTGFSRRRLEFSGTVSCGAVIGWGLAFVGMWCGVISHSVDLVLRIFVQGLFILPWDVAGSFAKYVHINLLFMNGKPSRQSLWMVFMSVAVGGLNMHWCICFT